MDGVAPAGVVSLKKPGLYLVGYESRESVSELTAEKLALYVEEEGLGPQLEGTPPAGAPIRDAFARSAKTLLFVPGGDTGGYDRRLGLPLELIPLADPHHLAKGSEPSSRPRSLPLELLYRGKPLPGILVTALHREDPLHPFEARTDGEGRVDLPLARAGVWLIKAVRIERAPAGAEVSYHSLWASLTFEVSGP